MTGKAPSLPPILLFSLLKFSPIFLASSFLNPISKPHWRFSVC